MRENIMWLLAVLMMILLSGCAGTLNPANSSEFSCPGMPGVMCKTPGQVYQMTQGDGLDVAALNPMVTRPSSKKIYQINSIVNSDTPMPIRVPAKVMRIWIAPWTDRNDDLHWPSYVYTEIETRKWNFGEPDFKAMSPVIPYKNKSDIVGQPNAEKHTEPRRAAIPPPSENP